MSESNSADGDGSGDGESAKTIEQVEKPQVVHMSEQTHDEYVGRGPADESTDADATHSHLNNTDIGARGWLGNPFLMSENTERGEYSRSEAIEKYAEALQQRLDADPSFKHALISLEGKRLGCWCRRSDESRPACHGDVIVSAVVGILESGEADVGEYGSSDSVGGGQ